MRKKDEFAEQGGGLWGSVDEAPIQKKRWRDQVESKISNLPAAGRKKAYGALVLAVAALFVGSIVGAALAVSQQEGLDSGKEALRDLPDRGAAQGGEDRLAERFVDADSLDFLSEDSLDKLREEFCSYLADRGYDDATTVKAWSSVEREGSTYRFYLSSSGDGQFFAATFDVETKTFGFEPVEAPEDMPELRNGMDAAELAASDAVAEGSGGSSGSEAAPEPEPEPAVKPAPATSTCRLSDTAELSTILPSQALDYLPEAVIEFAASKGLDVNVEDCEVNLSSITVANSNPYFEVSCKGPDGASAVVSCEWDAGSGRFGMAIIG